MKIVVFYSLTALIFSYSSLVCVADDGGSLPYNFINQAAANLERSKVDGVDCIPLYVKSKEEGIVLDPKKARFRVQTKDAKDELLKVEMLTDIPEGERSEFEKNLMKKGFTYRLWLPVNKESFIDGSIVHSLPKGTVEMEHGLFFKKIIE